MSNEMVDLGFQAVEKKNNNSMTEIAESRAQHEVQAAFIMAKKFPRNQAAAYAEIIQACKRRSLAEQSMYAYPRGGKLTEGPTIRLAECLAQNWGNLECGVREISQSGGVSVAEAYAIDLQTNTRVIKIFHVKHERHTKTGVTKLNDPRDIYELVANQGARRLRACILGIIPGDVVEEAVLQCRKTLESSDIPISEQVKKMVVAFDELGVKVEHLEKRLGHKLDATVAAEVVTLKSIYKSLRDGMSSREDFFDAFAKENNSAKETVDSLIADKKKKIDDQTGEILEDGRPKK